MWSAGGALGLGFGFAGIRALLSINTADLPRLGERGASVVIDWRVMEFTLAVAIGTGIILGCFRRCRARAPISLSP